MTTTANGRPAAPTRAASRGARSLGMRRWPGATPSRSRGLITLAALLVVGFGLATGLLVARAGDKAAVLVLVDGVAEGQRIERSDVSTQPVAGVADTIAADRVGEVVGSTAAVDLVPGQVLTSAMLTAAAVPGAGESLVGLSLDPSRAPTAGLDVGDAVRVIAVPAGQDGGPPVDLDLETPVALAEPATVFGISGSATEGGVLLVTVLVDAADADRLAAYSTSGRVALVEVGGPTEGSVGPGAG